MIILLSIFIFLATLVGVLSGKMNRAVAAMGGAVLMVVFGRIFRFYTEEQAMAAVDYSTIGLLLGMMILVALTQSTGLFDSLAVWTARYSKGKPVRLFTLLCGITSLASLYLDNLTTVLLVAPITILIARRLQINAQPYLIAEVILSNIAGAATLIGNPPNILIASAAGLPFDDFLSHAFPVIFVAWLAALFVLRFLFREELAVVPPALEAIQKLKPGDFLKDREGAFRLQIVLGLALVFFLRQDLLGVSPALIAVAVAVLALFWLQPDFKEILKQTDWEVLLLIAALFVLVGGLIAAGVFQNLTHLISQNQHFPPVLLGILFLWVAAILSAVVDNIPVTIALIPVVEGLGAEGIATTPLWWALVFGAGLGANGTILGSATNILIASFSSAARDPITPQIWIQKGLPVMLVTCAVASLFYFILYPQFTR